jgi:tetraacyldisaccharide 4'-kinase
MRDAVSAILRARLEPARDTLNAIGTLPVFAFAGIGDPEKFFMTLAAAGITPRIWEPYPDHHPYSEQDAQRILARCDADHLVPVTTEKDLARLSGRAGARGRLAAAAIAIPVTLVPDDTAMLPKLLEGALRLPL